MYFSIKNVFSRWWILAGISNFIVLFLLFKGNSMQDHGGINRTILVLFSSLEFLAYAIIIWLIKFYKRLRHKLLFLTPFIVILALMTIFYFLKIRTSCEGWTNGLDGKSLINDGKHCTVPIPTYCEFNIRDKIFDVNILTSECENKKMKFNHNMLLGPLMYSTTYTHLGFPRTEDYSNRLKIDKEAYRDTVKASMIDMNDTTIPQKKKENVEFMLDMSDPKETKLNVNVKQNSTRAEEQRALRESIIEQEISNGTYKDRVDKNVLIFYIDNLSRVHFYRKMPKVAEWLEKFTAQSSSLAVNEFFRYHSVYYNTLWTNNAMYYGETKHVKNDSQDIFDTYSQNGYITGFVKDACEMTSNSFASNQYDTVNIHRWDHHASSFTCDLNYDKSEAVTSLDMFHGKNSVLRR
jgi:hypothetical protein